MYNTKLEKALNEQINKEMASAYLYLGMATHFEAEGLSGFAAWMHKNANEEMDHAMKIYHFLFDVNARPQLSAIDAVKTEYGKPIDVVKEVLKHEEFITECVNNLYKLSLEENDYKTQMFLQWFISEQVEEENKVRDILDKFKFIGDNTSLLFIDKELSSQE